MTFAVNSSLTFAINKEIYSNLQVHIMQSPQGFYSSATFVTCVGVGAGEGIHPCACQKTLQFN
jgi:hypothetical protein